MSRHWHAAVPWIDWFGLESLDTDQHHPLFSWVSDLLSRDKSESDMNPSGKIPIICIRSAWKLIIERLLADLLVQLRPESFLVGVGVRFGVEFHLPEPCINVIFNALGLG